MTIAQPATAPAPAPLPAPAPVRRVRSVPARVRTTTGVALLSLALLFGALALGSASARDGLRVIGHDAGPQVIATAGLYLGLSDMDAQVADALLMGNEYGDRRQAALARYDQRRSEANQALLKAFELSGDDPAERRTIQSVIDGVGRYERLAAQALLLDTQAGHTAGPPPERVLQVYRQATDLMRLELLPQAYNLTLESGTIVRETHDEQSGEVRLLRLAVIVFGLLALAALVSLQLYLSRTFRRTLAPALLTATALTAVCLIAGAVVLDQEVGTLDEAKRDGFDSVLTLARSRAIGNSLHADQSRYLLDPARADTYEHAFLDKSQSLVYVEGGNVDAYHKALRGQPKQILGLLGDRTEILDTYRRFQAADGSMRALATRGRKADAVSAKLGNTDFAAYDEQLVKVSERHEAVFSRAVADGDGALDGLWRLLPFGIGAIAVLVVAGVWPRLREYR